MTTGENTSEHSEIDLAAYLKWQQRHPELDGNPDAEVNYTDEEGEEVQEVEKVPAPKEEKKEPEAGGPKSQPLCRRTVQPNVA